MKHVKLFEQFSFLNEKLRDYTYKSLCPKIDEIILPYEKDTVLHKLVSSGSTWPVGHPNGSISVTVWTDKKDFPLEKMSDDLKQLCEKEDLILFGNVSLTENDPDAQDWGNKQRFAKYVATLHLCDENNDLELKLFSKGDKYKIYYDPRKK